MTTPGAALPRPAGAASLRAAAGSDPLSAAPYTAAVGIPPSLAAVHGPARRVVCTGTNSGRAPVIRSGPQHPRRAGVFRDDGVSSLLEPPRRLGVGGLFLGGLLAAPASAGPRDQNCVDEMRGDPRCERAVTDIPALPLPALALLLLGALAALAAVKVRL